jgi:hypothetical protein
VELIHGCTGLHSGEDDVIDLLVENPHMLPQWLLGFVLSISVFLGIWWFVRKYKAKGIVAVFVIGVFLSLAFTSSGEDCDTAGSEPCQKVDPMLPIWIMLSLFAPGVTDTLISDIEGENEARGAFEELDEKTRDAIYREQQVCYPRYYEDSSAAFRQCMQDIASQHDLSRHVLTLISRDVRRRGIQEHHADQCDDLTSMSCFDSKVESESPRP